MGIRLSVGMGIRLVLAWVSGWCWHGYQASVGMGIRLSVGMGIRIVLAWVSG